MAIKKGGLGRGLDALFADNATDNNLLLELSINEIEPNREQPRKDFDEQSLSALAESIEKHGLLQPIVVRPRTSGRYEIVAGERRWRACRLAGLTHVSAVVKELDEQQCAEAALIENLQREDLNPYEEALGYDTLIKKFSLTQEQVSEKVSKSRTAVTNALRLLKLPEDILSALREGKISAGQARTLVSAQEEKQSLMFKMALEGASVRELEVFLKKSSSGNTQSKKNSATTFEKEVALALKEALHRKVVIKSKGKGKGTLTVEFFSQEELKDFAKRLGE